jgi:hypothetical protein
MMMRSSHRLAIAVIGAIAVVVLIIGIALAASGGGNDGAATATATATATNTPRATATAPVTSLTPTGTAPPPTATQQSPAPASTPTPPPVVTSPGQSTLPPANTATMTPPPGASTLPASDLPPLPPDRQRIAAPIDGLEVLTQESFPPQYVAHITAGLPNGCAQKGGWEASRSGSTITVKVYDTMPTQQVACTMIYGTYELNVPLGSDYTSGQQYTVQVNDKTVTFTAQ